MNTTSNQVGTWVSEAERGYDPEVLKKLDRGRPGRRVNPSQVVAVRLTDEELTALDRLADERHLSRSELVRQAISANHGGMRAATSATKHGIAETDGIHAASHPQFE